MKRRLVLTVFFACMATFAAILPSFASAQSAPAAEKQKIEALIKQVGDLKDAKFVRNGWTYEPATAVRFLRGKWEANDGRSQNRPGFHP